MTAFNIRNNEDYWREKVTAFLHDPPDKALSIWDHVKRVERIKDELYISADGNLIGKADQVASGLDRTFLPDSQEGGFIDFLKEPVITSPTASGKNLKLANTLAVAEDCFQNIIELISKDENFLPKNQPLRSFALFHYLRHVLPYRLSDEGTCGLFWQWERLPADTRIPDHTIWQHCALTSALYSCYKLSGEKRASLMIFSLTPVQGFIASSRKLRDYWTSSLILSWLSAEGMKAVIFNYGSDHIVYPWPVGQPLIERTLDIKCGFPEEWHSRYTVEVRAATLPNKFVCLVPSGHEEKTAELITDSINNAWKDLSVKVLNEVKEKCFRGIPPRCTEAFEKIFYRQTENFWEFHWAAVPLLDDKDIKKDEYKKFLPENLCKMLDDYLSKAKNLQLKYTSYHTEKFFYPLSHDIAQRGLSAEKLTPENKKENEPGIKCHLHTDLEALRFSCLECFENGMPCELNKKEKPDPNPRPSRDPCWIRIRESFSKTEFKETERLSSIGLIKRLTYRVISDSKDHLLHPFFKDAVGFPSTTEVAASDWLKRAETEIDKAHLSPRHVAEMLHRYDSPKSEWDEIEYIDAGKREVIEKITEKRKEAGDDVHIVDRYYALLMMDGDRMGRLLSGGFSAKWRDVIHPELVIKRLSEEKVDKSYVNFWRDRLDNRRFLSPSVHGAISQSLSEFALYTVPAIVKKYSGWLIYAGGDDVCAVFPVSTAADVAIEISKAYNWAFARIIKGVPQEVYDGSNLTNKDKLIMHLGPGEEISISAGLLIVHHKWPLRSAIQQAHDLLETAKNSRNENGLDRAAMAISLHRRAGGERTFVAGFRDECLGINVWNAFKGLVDAISKQKISSSFIYGLAELEDGLNVLRDRQEDFVRLIYERLRRSNVANFSQPYEVALDISALLLGMRKSKEENKGISTEVLEICDFIAEAVRRKNKAKTTEKHNDPDRAMA